MYAGAALVLVSIGGVVARGWAAWEPGLRWSFAGLTTLALIAAGLFVRLPWSRSLTDERRRAVSALLTAGVAVAMAGVAAVLGSGQEAPTSDPGTAARALGVVLAMLVVNLVARTPTS
jgi:glucose dehydrogenase